jgi:hypothetical protein
VRRSEVRPPILATAPIQVRGREIADKRCLRIRAGRARTVLSGQDVLVVVPRSLRTARIVPLALSSAFFFCQHSRLRRERRIDRFNSSPRRSLVWGSETHPRIPGNDAGRLRRVRGVSSLTCGTSSGCRGCCGCRGCRDARCRNRGRRSSCGRHSSWSSTSSGSKSLNSRTVANTCSKVGSKSARSRRADS